MLGTGNGTTTIPANLLNVGSVIRIDARGLFTDGSTPGTWSYYLTVGSSSAASQVTAPGVSLTNKYWNLSCDVTIQTAGSSGQTINDCSMLLNNSGTGTTDSINIGAVTTTINTTIANAVNALFLFPTATTTEDINTTQFVITLEQ